MRVEALRVPALYLTFTGAHSSSHPILPEGVRLHHVGVTVPPPLPSTVTMLPSSNCRKVASSSCHSCKLLRCCKEFSCATSSHLSLFLRCTRGTQTPGVTVPPPLLSTSLIPGCSASYRMVGHWGSWQTPRVAARYGQVEMK